MPDNIYQNMIQPKGRAYRDSQIVLNSHYRDPIDQSPGRLAGNSHIWGDASQEVQSRVIDTIIETCETNNLTPRQTAYVLAIARVESGFNPDAAAGTTSAHGLGQFINETGSAYGLNDENRNDVSKQAEALVNHYLYNEKLANNRGQDESYIYKYHHDGPSREYGGLDLSQKQVMPYLDQYTQFVNDHRQNRGLAAETPSQVKPETPSAQMYTFDTSRVYRIGAQGAEVTALQEQLNRLGITDGKGRPLNPDADFGSNTKAAVENFQRQHGLTVDGVAGKDTLTLLNQLSLQHQKDKPQVVQQPGTSTPSIATGHERILVAGIAGFDLGTGNKGNVAPSSVTNPDATYEYSMKGRDKGNSDKDKFKEIDCSGLVYHSLKNAGYRVDEEYPNMNNKLPGKDNWKNFTTQTLFKGDSLQPYAKKNFDAIPAKDAKPGDIIMFKKPSGSNYQHVGIVAEVKDGKVISYYGAQSSTGPAVTKPNPNTMLGVVLRPKDSFYDPSRDLTKKVPEGFNKRYEQIRTQQITPKTKPGKPDYPLLDNGKSWANIKTTEREPSPQKLSPAVQAIKDTLDSGLKPTIMKLGATEKAASNMIAAVTNRCVRLQLYANEIGEMIVNPDKNRLVVTSNTHSNKFVSEDAIKASRQNPAEQYQQATQTHEANVQDKVLAQQQMNINQQQQVQSTRKM